jgi:hypothetical protein
MRLMVSLLLVAFIAPAATAQQPPAGTAGLILRGVVVTANDVPLPRVRVALAPSTLSPVLMRLGTLPYATPFDASGVLTDERGQFTIQAPVKASVRLAFAKARYVSFTADVSPRDLTAPSSGIRVSMSLAGAISGQLFDRSGARLMLASVVLRRAGDPTSAPPISMTTTNDLGEYRFGGLPAGRYVVRAQSSALALGADNADRQKIVEAAAVESPAVSVNGTEIANFNLTLDAPSEMDRDRAIGADPEATGSVSGRVMGVDGLPVVRAVVHVYRPYVAGRQVETDLRGQFRIDRLGPGDYVVEARKYGFDTTRGRPVTLRIGQAVESIDMTLTRGGAIAGTIVDEFGEPMHDVAVGVLQLQSAGGRTRAVRATAQGLRTDDRGQYRLFGIKPGTYVVQAVVRDTLADSGRGYLPRFYPGTPTIEQATTVKVDFSATVSGVDLTLVATPSHRVTGSVLDASGKPGRGEVVLAVSERSGAVQMDLVATQIRADGSFEFTNVAPGDYVVQAGGMNVSLVPGGSRMQSQFATSFVTVSATDPPAVRLSMTQGATLAGRVRYEGVPPGPTPLLTLMVRSTDRDRGPLRAYGSTSFSPQTDNSFEFSGAFGPALLQAQPQQNDWYLKSVVFKGQDITDTPFDFGAGGSFRDIEVLISTLGATVTGRVTDGRGDPVADCTVLVFSTSRDRWFDGSRWLKAERPAGSGAFTATGLPPGDYWVAAIQRQDRTVERGLVSPERDVLDSLSSLAVRITLAEGESQSVSLSPVRR